MTTAATAADFAPGSVWENGDARCVVTAEARDGATVPVRDLTPAGAPTGPRRNVPAGDLAGKRVDGVQVPPASLAAVLGSMKPSGAVPAAPALFEDPQEDSPAGEAAADAGCGFRVTGSGVALTDGATGAVVRRLTMRTGGPRDTAEALAAWAGKNGREVAPDAWAAVGGRADQAADETPAPLACTIVASRRTVAVVGPDGRTLARLTRGEDRAATDAKLAAWAGENNATLNAPAGDQGEGPAEAAASGKAVEIHETTHWAVVAAPRPARTPLQIKKFKKGKRDAGGAVRKARAWAAAEGYVLPPEGEAPAAPPEPVRSPLTERYLAAKAEHPGTILLFRVGDFYETLFEDAELAADTLNITLTSRGKGTPGETPMAGFPSHALRTHLSKLIRRGHRVAVIEQHDAGEVTQVVTPGTLTDGEDAPEAAPEAKPARKPRKKAKAAPGGGKADAPAKISRSAAVRWCAARGMKKPAILAGLTAAGFDIGKGAIRDAMIQGAKGVKVPGEVPADMAAALTSAA